MKCRWIVLIATLLALQAGEAIACSVCYGAPNSKSGQNMAIAIWFLMAAVMSVLGGVGAFGFHLYRHSKMPLEPHQELTQEDLDKYE